MNCDICNNPVRLNQEEFVIDEEPITMGTTLVNFLAHKVCWDIQNPSFQYTNVPGYGGYTSNG